MGCKVAGEERGEALWGCEAKEGEEKFSQGRVLVKIRRRRRRRRVPRV